MKTANQVAQKWRRAMGNAAQSVREGVEGVTSSPMEAAARSKELWMKKLAEAQERGTWEKGLREVSLEEWKQKFITKGIPRMAQGAEVGAKNMEAFMQDFLPFAQSVSDRVKTMPKGTLQDSLERMRVAMEAMASYKGRG